MIICADARSIPLKDKSVQCVVTSPPYWGLRDYGTGRGSAAMQNVVINKPLRVKMAAVLLLMDFTVQEHPIATKAR